MEKFIGVKIIHAELQLRNNQIGYRVIYPDGYESWSPKDVFEKAYRKFSNDENTVTQEDVDSFISNIEITQLGDKTTIVKATLVNGFILVESSSCVDVKNFDMKIGADICMDKIKDKVWFLLGFLLQCGDKGLNN